MLEQDYLWKKNIQIGDTIYFYDGEQFPMKMDYDREETLI